MPIGVSLPVSILSTALIIPGSCSLPILDGKGDIFQVVRPILVHVIVVGISDEPLMLLIGSFALDAVA